MQDDEKIKQYGDEWAYDLKISGFKSDGIVNTDVINQSIEMILATPPGSRLFNISFGSLFSLRVFDNMTRDSLRSLLEDTLSAIAKWEDRITIITPEVSLEADQDKNMVTLTIPYIINERRIFGVFSKVIRQ